MYILLFLVKFLNIFDKKFTINRKCYYVYKYTTILQKRENVNELVRIIGGVESIKEIKTVANVLSTSV